MTLRDLMLTSAVMVGTAGMASAQDGYAFDELDTDGDGTVTLAELETGFDTGVNSEANPSAVLEAQDANDNGVIDRDEAGSDMAIYPLGAEDEGDEDDDDV